MRTIIKTLSLLLFCVAIFPAFTSKSWGKFTAVNKGWYVYGMALYQIMPVIETIDGRQTKYDSKVTYGLGVGKDHLRIELGKLYKSSRFLLAFDLFPQAVATPYLAYAYGIETNANAHKSGASSTGGAFTKSNMLIVGVTIQPVRYFNLYGEMNIADRVFLAGLRFKLPIQFIKS